MRPSRSGAGRGRSGRTMGWLGGGSASRLLDGTTWMCAACSFQDIINQRIAKVAAALKEVGSKVTKISVRFGCQRHTHPEWQADGQPLSAVKPLLNGPQHPTPVMGRSDIAKLPASFDGCAACRPYCCSRPWRFRRGPSQGRRRRSARRHLPARSQRRRGTRQPRRRRAPGRSLRQPSQAGFSLNSPSLPRSGSATTMGLAAWSWTSGSRRPTAWRGMATM